MDAPEVTPQNFEAGLRASVREHVRAQSEPAASETPVEATPETPAVPDVPAATEIPSETTAAPEVKASPESTSSDQPAPASTTPQTSAVETLAKRGLKFEDEKTAAEYLRVESELARRVRAEKEAARTQPATATQPEPQQAAPEPTTTVQPAKAETPKETAPPTPAAEPQTDLDVRARQLTNEDPECVALASEWTALGDEIGKLGINFDQYGQPAITGGRAAELQTEIADLQRQLAGPSEALKKRGIEIPTLDPVTRESIKTELANLRGDLRDVIDEARSLNAQRSARRQAFLDRESDYRSSLEQGQEQARAEADRIAAIDARADVVMRAWVPARDAAFQTHNVPEKLRPKVERMLRQAFLAEPEVVAPEHIPAFIDRVLKEQYVELTDEFHRARSAEYAALKRADAQAATQAPSGPAAVAPPAKTDTQDWEKRLRAEARAARAALAS